MATNMMRALVLEEAFHLELKRVPVPEVPEGYALVRMQAVSVCGSDIHAYKGNSLLLTYPRVLGHELCGVVEQLNGPDSELTNCVKPIYDPFTDRELAAAIADLLRPEGLRAELALVFQSCADLADCCPNHRGDWYFTGEYPTPGGFRVVNRALVNYVEHIDARAY